jgi:hypothetical protein
MEIASGHRRMDERGLALHRAIAQKLREHPDLLQIARDNLLRWRVTAGRSFLTSTSGSECSTAHLRHSCARSKTKTSE